MSTQVTSPPIQTVTVSEPVTQVVSVSETTRSADVRGVGTQGPPGPIGPAGPQGEKGDPGTPGLPGNAAFRYVFTQSTPASTWVIPHGLGYLPSSIVIYDSAGSEVEGDVLSVSFTTLTIQFSGGFSGTAVVA